MSAAGHHRRHLWENAAARTLLAVGILLCGAAVADFAYQAHQTSGCFVAASGPSQQGSPPRAAVGSEECRIAIPRRNAHLFADCVSMLLGVAVLIGAAVDLSHAHRRTKRLVLAAEFAVVLLTVFYSLLWSYGPR